MAAGAQDNSIMWASLYMASIIEVATEEEITA